MMLWDLILWGAAAFWMSLLGVVLFLWRYRLLLRPGVVPTPSEGVGEDSVTRCERSDGSCGDLVLVSVLIPARDEERRVLREAIGSVLAQEYPHLEVIVVDDRSTDRTLEILHEMARADARVRVIAGEDPPPGWWGKPFALHQACARARGEWVLAMDADVILHPAAVPTALRFALAWKLDALSLLPKFEYVSFWDRLIEPLALNLLRLSMLIAAWRERAHRARAARPSGRAVSRRPLALLRAYVGAQAFTIGAFTLMRRRALDGIGGYAAIRSEVLDETILGLRLAQAGYRVFAVEGAELLRTPARGTFRELWEAYSRSFSSAFGSSPVRALLGATLVIFLAVLPPLVVIARGIQALGDGIMPLDSRLIAAALAYGAMSLLHIRLSESDRQPARYGLLSFLGCAVFAALALTIPWRVRFGRGIMWRGRCVSGASAPADPRISWEPPSGSIS